MKTKSLYIASLEKNSGSLVVSIGLMQFLKAKYSKVAFYRPVIESLEKEDNDINTIHKYFNLDMKYEESYGVSIDELENYIANNKQDNLYEKILCDVEHLQKSYDFVLIEGISKDTLSTAIDFDINLALAKNISTPIIAILNGKNKSYENISEDLEIEKKAIQKSKVKHFATFVNRVDKNKIEAFIKKSKKEKYEYIVDFLPEKKGIDALTLGQIKKELGCELLFGEKSLLEKQIGGKKIAAMRAEHFINKLENNDLVITPSDRIDILLALASIYYSSNFPNISGVVLSGDMKLDETMLRILKGFDNFALPILKIEDDTYGAIKKIEGIKTIITHQDTTKIASILGLFSQYISLDLFEEKLADNLCETMTPVMFKHSLIQKAMKSKKTIVLPESMDERVLKAAAIVLKSNLADIILVGNKDEIINKATSFGIGIAKATIIDPKDSKLTEIFAKEYEKLRSHKGLKYEAAYDTMKNDESYFATMMVHLGYADGMVSGAVNTTANTVRPALQIIKTKAQSDVVSSLFFMTMETQVLVYADCAINTNPSASELASIAIDSSDNAKAFGVIPKIAMLSYSTSDSGSGNDVQKVKEATRIVKERRPDLQVEGPIQYDAAIDKSIAKKKLPDSCVAGVATVFIFPDLNTGNNTYKAVRDASGADAIGPVLQGLNKPVNDLSRGCNVEDIVNTIVITAIQGDMK